MKLPVYSRADLSRTVALVVALFLTAVPTSTVAREFRAADIQSEDYPTVQVLNYMSRMIAERSDGRHQIKVFHSRQLGEERETIEQTRAAKWKDLEERSRRQAEAAGAMIVTDFDRKPFQAAIAGIYARAQSDPAAAELIERIRKVE